ncbi:transcription factor grauzone-like isoform X4 [Lucilia sericata]|uniref:transcription factor grauzone-like isoform X4 n=1 Tax=Lucilia sericata TaxID=13632 RepID=UPI0018A87B76|nr:transcription factor grauzone-like isoform X4 [Lucilia sericata]
MLCCTCLMETPKMLGIYDEKGINLNMADIIDKYFWFKTNPDNSLTSHICSICWNRIEDFHDFYQSVEKVHKTFKQNQHKLDVVKEEIMPNIKLEEDEHQDEITYENKLLQMEIDIKEAAENNIEQSVSERNPLDNEQFHSDGNEEENFDNEGSITTDGYEPSDNSETEEVLNTEKSENVHKKKETKKKRSSHRLDPILIEQLIKKHIPMLCDLCVFSGKTFADIIAHFKEHHSQVQPYIMCCNRKFTRSYCIDQHAIIHENPDSFRCNECNRSFTTTYGLRTHNLNHHAPEEKRIHACEFCPRRFGRRQLLEVHRQTHIPKEEWTITCTKCTTRTVKFVSQYLLNIHNSMFHRREANICHVCAKEIKDKKAFEKHVRAHFEDSGPRVKCTYPNCGRWLKDEDNLKTHMQLHNLAGKTYKCSECAKECPNRRALTNHKRYVHSNPTFRCEECDKTFKKAISLREHMTQHTGETLYSCPFCTRTFNSNANMHAHKKKQHPNEWKELRRKNIGPLPN